MGTKALRCGIEDRKCINYHKYDCRLGIATV